jgi:tetratricopeptide (TPR) repeat protein
MARTVNQFTMGYGLMSLWGMVNIPHLRAKREAVMLGKPGIQRGGGGANTQNLDSRLRGNDGTGRRFGAGVFAIPRFQPEGCLALLLPVLLLAASCLNAELEKQAETLKAQEAEIARQRQEIEAIRAGRQVQEKKQGDCNRAFRDYFEPAQTTADGDRAVTLYRDGLALCQDDEVAHYELGRLLAAQGHYGEAETEFETALKLNPDFTDARARLDTLRTKR